MDIRDRLALFSDQIQCGVEIFTWHYDAEMRLLETNCPDDKKEYLDATLYSFGGKDAIRENAKASDYPQVISIPIGMMWCAAIDHSRPEAPDIYLIGPVWSTEASVTGVFRPMEEIHRSRGADMEWMMAIAMAHRELPVVMPQLMYQYALMLHCVVTGEKLALSDLVYEQAHGVTEPAEQSTNDRVRIWQAEQELLRMVRDGDMGYAKAFNRATTLSKGVNVEGADALRQAKISVIVFISICTRAAIEGGLSPEEAYTLGEQYIQSVESSRNITDVGKYSYGMYADFVERVHNKHVDPTVSRHIRAVCDYIEIHADEPFTNEDLARRAGYAEPYLRRKFAQEMHISLPDYIRKVRIERAKNLLKDPALSIQEIADTLQFCSRGHFSDSFAKVVGETPAKFREHYKA